MPTDPTSTPAATASSAASTDVLAKLKALEEAIEPASVAVGSPVAIPTGAVSGTTLAPVAARQTADAWATQLATAAHIYAGARVAAGWTSTQVLTQAEFNAGLNAFTSATYGHGEKRSAPTLTATSTGGYRRAQPQIMQGRAFGVSTAPLGTAGAPKGRTTVTDARANARKAADRLRALGGLPVPPPKSK